MRWWNLRVVSKTTGLFDLSNLNGEYKDNTYRKIQGAFKSETGDLPILEFVGLRAKMYSCLTSKGNISKAAGTQKSIIDRNIITHQHYVDTVKNHTTKYNLNTTFKTKDFKISTIAQNKKSLSPYDDKFFINDDGITSMPWGYYKNKDKEMLLWLYLFSLK